MTELTRDALAALIADDEHGLLTPEAKPEPVTNADIASSGSGIRPPAADPSRTNSKRCGPLAERSRVRESS